MLVFGQGKVFGAGSRGFWARGLGLTISGVGPRVKGLRFRLRV